MSKNTFIFNTIKSLYLFDGYNDLPRKDKNIILDSMFLTISALVKQLNSPIKFKWVKNHKEQYKKALINILTDRTLTEYESFHAVKNLLPID